EGSAIGIHRKGVGFSVTIEQPLKKVMQLGCYRNFVSGILVIQNDKGSKLR
ncbi:MAG: hypothetical protein QG635_2069, partial [Bacteroidota bacterium]|nr:hypothetical protein [Bacteroidota bacterium]